MNLDLICAAMRNPAGLPSHPAIFLVLLVVTWALHIIAVHIMLGSTALSLLGSYRQHGYWQRLSANMLSTAKVSVSIAIVLGVAPLLFVQSLYDHWYISTLLSARWAIGFIFILLAAYYAMYYRYFASQQSLGRDYSRLSLALSLALLLLAGFIIHVLSSQMLRPDMWMEWYAPNGHIDASGSKLHEYNQWRYLYFIGLSVPVTGAWILAYQHYLKQSQEPDTGYIAWLNRLGSQFMSLGGALSFVFYLLWLSTLPENASGFAISLGSFLGLIATLALAITPVLVHKLPPLKGYSACAVTGIAVLLIAIARESLRITTFHNTCHFNVLDYPVHFDWYSSVLFFLTFVLLGIPVIVYSIALSWHAGQSKGVYTASPTIEKLGRYCLIALGVWVSQYFLFGLITVI